MRRAKLEGRHIGWKALVLDRAAILRDRQQGQSLGQLAKAHLVSRTTIYRVLGEQIPTVTEGAYALSEAEDMSTSSSFATPVMPPLRDS
jgi:hypothetical protein